MHSSLFPIYRLCLIIGLFASLTACGIKPGSLEHPTSPGQEPYPRTYPAADDIR